jgi:hypothetical protein
MADGVKCNSAAAKEKLLRRATASKACRELRGGIMFFKHRNLYFYAALQHE